MTEAHPSFPNPSLVEMLCEIHFVPLADRAWDSKRPLPLYQAVAEDFPQMELLPEANFHVDFSGGVMRPSLKQNNQRIRFSNNDNSRLLQISSAGDVFVMNVVNTYPGWIAVKEFIIRYWNSVQGILAPRAITRVGLRYINRIELGSNTSSLSDWLKPTRSIPSVLINSMTGSSSRVDVKLNNENRSIVTIQFLENPGIFHFGSIVMDIDRIWESKEHSQIVDLESLLETLHGDVWNEFDSALGDKFLASLNRITSGV